MLILVKLLAKYVIVIYESGLVHEKSESGLVQHFKLSAFHCDYPW